MSKVRRGKGTEVWRETIEGGYRQISVVQLCMCWSLYVRGRISRRDLRVWFACHELEERRCMVERGGKVRFTPEEFGEVTGGLGPADVRAALRALEDAKLVVARKSRMCFARSTTELEDTDGEAAAEMLARITNRRRVIRVPRRLVRELAAGMSKAVTATVFAHLIRCLYFQAGKGRYRVDGRCKASWIADTFSVSERAVMTARRKLIEQGWLVVMESSQWEMNRYGLRLAVEPNWSSRPLKPRRRSACPPRETAGRTACPKANSTLLRKNRTLGPRPNRIGVRNRTKRGRSFWIGTLGTRDLSEPLRLEALRLSLVASGLVDDSSSDRLRVFGAAAHALRLGHNPCGLFWTIVRDKLWNHISQADEEHARLQLSTMSNTEHGRPTSRRSVCDIEPLHEILQSLELSDKHEEHDPVCKSPH